METALLEHIKPTDFLLINYPNPFSDATSVSFNVPEKMDVRLTVSTIDGKQITELLNEKSPGGVRTITFNGSDLPNGIYLYTLYLGDKKYTRKMVKE